MKLFRFDPNRKGAPQSVAEALKRLAANRITADYNYISSRSPMRSHAVSYAEPADPSAISPALPEFVDPEVVRPIRVGVLDTGRPEYDDLFRTYYRNRFPIIRDDRTMPAVPDKSLATIPRAPFDKINAVFKPDLGTSGASTSLSDPDRDTMVTSFGRLSHPHAGHGLFVSSIIARHAPDVVIVAEATMYRDAIADFGEILVDLADVIDEPHNCQLLNMSLGFPTKDDRCPAILNHALARLREKDVLLVASAGNDGSDRKMWPAAHRDVVAVAATDKYGTPTDWSNHGLWVDTCAFGDEVTSNYVYADWDFPDGTGKRFRGAARWSGTSFAAPLITACIANEMVAGGTARKAWTRLKRTGKVVDRYRRAIPDVYGVLLGPLPPD